MEPIRLVVIADENYMEPSCVTLTSALQHNPDARATLLTDNASSEACQLLKHSVHAYRDRIDIMEVDGRRFRDLTLAEHLPHLTHAVFWRLLIPELITDAPRALYMDGDVLVRDSLRALWEIDLHGHAFAAAVDDCIGLQKHLGHDPRRALGWPEDAPLFSAGVMLFDLDACRPQDLPGRVLDVAANRPELMIANEQSALNVEFAGRWQPLDPRWHGVVHPMLDNAGVEHAAMIHFMGTPKPWQPMCGSPFRDEWAALMDTETWYTPRPQERRAEPDEFPADGDIWLVGEGDDILRVHEFVFSIASITRFRGFIATSADPARNAFTVAQAIELSGDDDLFVNMTYFQKNLTCYILDDEDAAIYWVVGPATVIPRDPIA